MLSLGIETYQQQQPCMLLSGEDLTSFPQANRIATSSSISHVYFGDVQYAHLSWDVLKTN